MPQAESWRGDPACAQLLGSGHQLQQPGTALVLPANLEAVPVAARSLLALTLCVTEGRDPTALTHMLIPITSDPCDVLWHLFPDT